MKGVDWQPVEITAKRTTQLLHLLTSAHPDTTPFFVPSHGSCGSGEEENPNAVNDGGIGSLALDDAVD
jgi:hypothetical protein